MDQKEFIISSRYHVRPALHVVSDTLLQTEARVEPRLMKLLCILSEHPGQMVARERLIKEIWDDYGGGEDGLTQAISSLRKLLNDTSKELIVTIPKKGYILQAEIADPLKQDEPAIPVKEKSRPKPVLYAALLLTGAVLFAVAYLLLVNKEDAGLVSKPRELDVPFSEVNKKPEETWLNTITTVGEDSTQYKLKVTGDSRPEFYINGRLVSPDEMEKHIHLINNLKRQLLKRAS